MIVSLLNTAQRIQFKDIRIELSDIKFIPEDASVLAKIEWVKLKYFPAFR